MTKILAVIPAYNEGSLVKNVVITARAYLPVLVVNDGSTDDTARYAEEARAIVIHQRPNQGKGAALRRGFQWALDEGYEAAIMLDADGQHDPEEIPVFLEAYRETPTDLIIGARNFRQMPTVRRFTNTIGRWMYSWALGQPDRDNQSGYRLLSRRMMEAMLESKEHKWEFEVEMITVCIEKGYTLGWVPIRTIYGEEKSHIQPLRHIVHFFRIVWQTRQRIQRAKQQRIRE